jgi:hypothetical protein
MINERKKGESVACPFCGQTHILTNDVKIDTELEDVVLGAFGCGCADAVIYKTHEENKKRIPYLINDFEKFCKNNKVNLTQKAYDAIQYSAGAVIDEYTESITLDFYSVKAKLRLNSKGVFVLSASYKAGYFQTL